MSYTVTATRWEDGWELDIDGVGVTQCRALGSAEHMVRDYLRLDGLDADADLDIVIDLDGLEDEVRATKERTAAAARATREAADAARAIAAELRDKGLSVADTAAVLGVSKGRVSQLVH